MKLPELPKKINQEEADFGIKLRKWIMEKPRFSSSAHIEIKDTRGKPSIPFRELKGDQRGMAIDSKLSPKGNFIRIDKGTLGAPDYVWLYHAPSMFIINFPKAFYVIDVETLDLEIKRSKRKSLTEQRAREISIMSNK